MVGKQGLILSGSRGYEKSEDPIYVLKHNIPIDTQYYLENQLSKPLIRIFEPILGSKANTLCELYLLPTWIFLSEILLVVGEHTRTIHISTPTTGGLMQYAFRVATCLGCKARLRSSVGECARVSSSCISGSFDLLRISCCMSYVSTEDRGTLWR